MILATATASAQEQVPRGTVQLQVLAAGTSAPLPFADVAIAAERFTAFTDSMGRLTIRLLPAGPVTVRVRRIGFRSVDTTIRVTPRRDTPLIVRLHPVALQLTSIKVSGDVCPGGGSADTAVVAILQQAQLNAERYALLAATHPFQVSMERVFGEQGAVPINWSGRTRARRGDRVVQAHDTVDVAGRSEWRYAPGRLIAWTGDSIRDVARTDEKMVVPHLVDFADDAFVSTHCFRYAGLTDADSGRRALRVDFRPTRTVRVRDVRGHLYFDPRTYQILKSTLFAERPVPTAPATDTWLVRVDAWFSEILPGLPVLQRIETTTSLETTRGASTPFVTTEDHRMLALRFTHTRPGDDSFTGGRTGRATDVAGPLRSCATSVAARTLRSTDSVRFSLPYGHATVCYSALADTEDSRIVMLLDSEAEVAGVRLAPGEYALQPFFGADHTVVRVFARDSSGVTELARGAAHPELVSAPVERFSVLSDTLSRDPAFIVAWKSLRVRIPLSVQ